MTESISVAIEGEGDHEIMAAMPNSWITLFRTLITVSCPESSALTVIGKSGSTVLLGPFYMRNGGALTFDRENPPLMRCAINEPLVIELKGEGKLGGTLIVERGQV